MPADMSVRRRAAAHSSLHPPRYGVMVWGLAIIVQDRDARTWTAPRRRVLWEIAVGTGRDACVVAWSFGTSARARPVMSRLIAMKYRVANRIESIIGFSGGGSKKKKKMCINLE